MREKIVKQIEMFKIYNDITLKNEIVIYGGTFTAEFPFYELSQKQVLSNAIYNRSIKDITLIEAAEGLEDCVLSIRPAKLFLSLGEHDIDNPDALQLYDSILAKIRKKLPQTTVYILPIYSRGAEQFNHQIRALCKTKEIHFLNIHFCKNPGKLFGELSVYLRDQPLNMSTAFHIG